MDNFKNLYEVRKTVRFELKPSEKKSFDKGNITKLQQSFEKIQNNFLNIFIFKSDLEELSEEEIKDGKIPQYTNLEFRKKREIKYTWLRTHIKNKFYENTSHENKKTYEIKNLDYVSEEFLRWINEWQELSIKLKNLSQTEEHKQKRRSEIAFILRSFAKRGNFRFIKDFFFSVIDIQGKQGSESDKAIQEFRKKLQDIEKKFKACLKKYLPSQSNGVLLHKASLNYYTLNKTQKEYKQLKEDKEKDLQKKIIDCKNKWGKPEFFFHRKFNFGENPLYWNLDDAYQKIKIWKAEQKSDFLEAAAGDKLTVQNFKQRFPLFSTTDQNFLEFCKLTKELDDLEGKEAKEKAQKRGKFFNTPKQSIQTQNYYELCELYKRIAMKRGKIIAEIKGIKNEEVQSQLLTHWAVMTEKDEKKSVVFIPRKKEENLKNHKDAHTFLEKSEIKNRKKQEGDIALYHFKSLTFRALEKLCFKEVGNTFAPELKKLGLKTNFTRIKKEEGIEQVINVCDFPIYKQELKTDEEKINFYTEVLKFEKNKTVKKSLDLVDFGKLTEFLKRTDFKNLQEFESELEKVCYVKVPLYFSEEEFNDFKNKYSAEVFEITTRSISKERKRKENTHAKIWNDFWSDENKDKNHTTRLNPELSVFYRDAIEEKSNESQKNKKDDKINNRFSKPRYTLATTITLNATAEKTNLEFKTVDDIKKHIDKLNDGFNKRFDGKWVYGIDRGDQELASLCIVKFDKNGEDKNKYGVVQPQEFAPIEAWKINDLDKTKKFTLENGDIIERRIGDNPSYFFTEENEPDEEYFEKKEIKGALDLTKAKVIKNHLIINGDSKTHRNLKFFAGKRKIWELFSGKNINSSVKIEFIEKSEGEIYIGDDNKNVLAIKTNQKYVKGKNKGKDIYKIIYYLNNKTEEKEYWQKNLQEYLDLLRDKNRFKDLVSQEKVNHLRDAITANMVGVIAFLQKQFLGKIVLENLSAKEHMQSCFENNPVNIARRLEWALYRKFQNWENRNLVPPQIKETTLIREDLEVNQFGIIHYVTEENTSQNCPVCEEKKGKKTDEEFKTDKFDKQKFECLNCEFDTEKDDKIYPLNTNDEVAAYNVAKNIFLPVKKLSAREKRKQKKRNQ